MLAERGVYVGVYEKIDRVTVAEAAARLGVKEQAIRKRVQRGTIAHDKDVDGRVYVYLDPEDGATSTGIDTGMDKLLQSLQDHLVYLRQEAEDWKEEARRKDAIIMSLTQRFPELETPVEPPGGLQTASEGPTKGKYHGGSRSPHSAARGSTGSSGRGSESLVSRWRHRSPPCRSLGYLNIYPTLLHVVLPTTPIRAHKDPLLRS